jgi:hypothetical protein
MTRPEGLAEWEVGAMEVLLTIPPVLRRDQGSIEATVAIADELKAVTDHARKWLVDNPCPVPTAGRHFRQIIETYAQMASVVHKGYREKSKGEPITRRVAELARTSESQGRKLEEILERHR